MDDPADQTVCNNASTAEVNFASAFGVAGTTYSWTNDNTSIGLGASGNGNIAAFTATNSGSTPVVANITVTPSANGCTGTAQTFTITVNPTPVITITVAETSGNANDDGILCAGASATLTASGGTTYNWSTGETGASITVTTGGDYTVTSPSDNGCPGTASTTITVNPLPTPAIAVAETSGSADNDGNLCAGSSATLTASGGTSYAWSTMETSASITVSASGSYTVTVTDANGCSDTESTTITVNPLPTATITVAETSGNANNDGAICAGASATLTANAAASYTWSTGSTDASISVTTSGTYTVTITDANGCTDSESTTITVNPLPMAAVSIAETSGNTDNDGILCAGASATLTASGGTSYEWNTMPAQTTAEITVNTAGTYTVTVTDGNGCSSTASATITVNPLPNPSVSITETSGTANDGTICQGSEATLTASGGTSYAWSNGDSGSSITVTTGGTYTVTATDANGCSATAFATITVTIPTIPSFGVLGPYCQGSTPALLPSTSSNGVTGTWTPSNAVNTATVGTFVYTFTPTAGLCATPVNVDITINSLQITCPPGNQSLALNNSCSASLPDYRSLVSVVGDCTLPTLTQTPAPGTSVSGAGTVNVTITATLDGEVVSTCTITVTKVDNTQPSLTVQNATVSFDGQASITLNPASFVVSATDNCGDVMVSISPTSVSCAQVGQSVPVVITAMDINGNVITRSAILTVSGLPCNWSGATGGVNCSGTSAFNASNNTWTLTSTNCYYGPQFTADSHTFAKRTLCGNGVITALVSSTSTATPGVYAWAGVTMRETSMPGSKKVQLMTNLSNLSRREVRSVTGGSAFPQQFITVNRYWLRLVRSGNQFLGYVSPNGSTWYPVMAANVSMNQCIEVGLIVTGNQPIGQVSATFTNVNVSGALSPTLMAPEVNDSVLEGAGGIEVFPNPTEGLLNVNISNYVGKPVRIELYNMQGKLMEFSELDEVQAPLQEMDLSKYPGGAYFIRVKSEGLPDAVQRVILGNMWRP